eukprot:COSAG05_NODE_466_length_9533_cov_5.547806_10_plen_36_part_00
MPQIVDALCEIAPRITPLAFRMEWWIYLGKCLSYR